MTENNILYEFGDYSFDSSRRVLLKRGEEIFLTNKDLDILLLLLEKGGKILSKEELMEKIWPNTFVEEGNIAAHIKNIRRVLGEAVTGSQYITTAPKRGYYISVPISIKDERGKIRFLGNNPSLFSFMQKRTFQLTVVIIVIALCIFFIVKKNSIRMIESKSIQLAILPFTNLKSNHEIDFLSFSLSDALISKFSSIQSIKIRPSTAIKKYEHHPPENLQAVAKELNVNKIITGSYVKEGNVLRINTQIVDVLSNQILQLDSMDLNYSNLLVLQDQFATRLIQGLKINLTPAEIKNINLDIPKDSLAFEYYLRGIDLLRNHLFDMAIEMEEKSIALDPNYSLSWHFLGRAYNSRASYRFGGIKDYERALTSLQKALQLNPQKIDNYAFIANIFTKTNRVEEAVTLLRETLKKQSDLSNLHFSLAMAYRYGGMLQESTAECEEGKKYSGTYVHPFQSLIFTGQYNKFLEYLHKREIISFNQFYRGYAYFHMKEWKSAVSEFEQAYTTDPASIFGKLSKIFIYIIQRNLPQGLEILNQCVSEIKEANVPDPDSRYIVTQCYFLLGDKRKSLKLLEESIEGGFFCYPYLIKDPLTEGLHKEQEFVRLMETAKRRHEEFKRRFFS